MIERTLIRIAIATGAAWWLARVVFSRSKRRKLLTKVAQDKALPFEPLIPNATTIAAMKEARAGNLPRVNSIADLKDVLNADD
jgi:RelB antitoxin